MTEQDFELQKQKINRLIRDLNIRYIKGSLDRRTYQILKQKYLKMMDSIPQSYHETIPPEKEQEEEQKKQVNEEIEKIKDEITYEAQKTIISKIKIPPISLSGIPEVEIDELKIRYVMRLALKASAKIFEDELEAENEYVSGHISNKEYLELKNLLETKQHKIFKNYYKLSDTLETLTKKHIFKRAHYNFLLFTNELSENLNRLRGHEIDKYEVKGIIYEINNSVLRHRPIIKKAIEETKKWKECVLKEKEKFEKFREENNDQLSESDKEELKRRIRLLEIYVELLEEDINDYKTDLRAIEEVYGEHLQFQELEVPFFSDLSDIALRNIEQYNQYIRGAIFEKKLNVCSSVITRKLDYKFLAELNSLWKYSGNVVVDKEGELIGFVVGPGKLNDEYGAIIYTQREISQTMARRIFDYVIAPNILGGITKSDEEKKQTLLNEIPKVFPTVNYNYLVPEVIIEYCKKKEFDLSQELLKFLRQEGRIIFVPLINIEKGERRIIVNRDIIRETGELLPNFDLKKSNDITRLLVNNEETELIDIFDRVIGYAKSVVSHPKKGYFLIVKRDQLPTSFYATIYDLLYTDLEKSSLEQIDAEEKKWRLLFNLSREYEKSEAEVGEPEFLKKILIEKNTGVLPQDIDNAIFDLYSIGNIRIVGDKLQVSYLTPPFEVQQVFDVDGKIVENVKGKELGVVFSIKLTGKPELLIWSKINLLIIASFISDEPVKLIKEHKDFIDSLAISIGQYLSLAPQVALRPDNVLSFMNLIGKINSYKEIEEIMKKFDPTSIDILRVISIDNQRILVDVADIETEKIAASGEEIQEGSLRQEVSIEQGPEENREEEEYVASPDYYLKQRKNERNQENN